MDEPGPLEADAVVDELSVKRGRGRPRGTTGIKQHVPTVDYYPLAVPDNGLPVVNPDDLHALKEAEAVRLAVVKTHEKDIVRITGLSLHMVRKLKDEVETLRRNRVAELEARGEEMVLGDIYDEIIASEARTREWVAHTKYDPPTALKGQYIEAQYRMAVYGKILMPRLATRREDGGASVLALLEITQGESPPPAALTVPGVMASDEPQEAEGDSE